MITCGEYAESLRLAQGRVTMVLGAVTTEVVVRAAERARSYIGEDQADWDPLSPRTLTGFRHINGMWIEGKEELGFSPPDNPLLREGTLKASIEAEVITPTMGMIGSENLVALWQELGTPGAEYEIPPRPFLAKGMQETIPEMESLLEEAAVDLLVPW